MAYALGVPMVGVSSLDLLAFPLRWSSRLIVPVIDARRGEVFHAQYRQVPGGIQRVTAAAVSPPEELANELLATGDELLLVGDGALRHREVFEAITHVELAESGQAYPNAGSLLQLAHARALREEFVPHWELEPVYLRLPDAEINWATRAGLPAAGEGPCAAPCTRRAGPPAPMRSTAPAPPTWSSCRCAAATSAACCASRPTTRIAPGRSACS
jgi:tRNA threonylcarbamoyladenosine biosynthesis protein TsaB